ncbi:NAK/GAK protein kinase [Salpingoeca rosetta]|uniref:non-specific serine/threonine protein kinase n=1 Tax=Salpingoeca rosetta (strain ATCC 50818 / BSB-021) TaxID=946362 RepID=F2TZG7_SALR5|nr:NAK/GAK protein kinase [Salpingoeca rosetta]EGD78991.1 NAK/GAK protein kinase [Salpingoeca rosetta]|eukprot:XP_004997947.1 NAK/GAK protein kinase [Salpingoeca rosetta]
MSSVWDRCMQWWQETVATPPRVQADRQQDGSVASALSLLGGKEEIDLPGQRLRIERVIAQGGFAVVLEATDARDPSHKFALKKLLAHDRERLDLIKAEIKVMLSARSPAEVLLLMELCPGCVIDVVLSHEQGVPAHTIKSFFTQAADAVSFLHAQSPPIIHRDIKAENFLLTHDNVVKLCDFGSCTTETIDPAALDYRAKMATAERLEAMTTPQNRSPEMLDLFSEQPINEKLDVWALGCLLHVLCHRVHPFEDGAKLAIVNVKYKVPQSSQYAAFDHVIAERLFVKDVAARATAQQAKDAVAALDI